MILKEGPSLKGFAILLGGTAFFTVHFGGFHAVHIAFLIEMMPDSKFLSRGIDLLFFFFPWGVVFKRFWKPRSHGFSTT